MSNNPYMKPDDLELHDLRGSRANLEEIDEFDETNPLTVEDPSRRVQISPLKANNVVLVNDEYETDGEKSSLGPLNDTDEIDGMIGMYTNGNGTTIQRGSFPQWPQSYPQDTNVPPSLNAYQQKKSMAQGMLDLALLSANANQLRYVLDMREHTSYFYISIALIAISLVFQVLVAFALVFKARYNLENKEDYRSANRLNNFITIGILLITITNVLSSAFAPSTSQ